MTWIAQRLWVWDANRGASYGDVDWPQRNTTRGACAPKVVIARLVSERTRCLSLLAVSGKLVRKGLVTHTCNPKTQEPETRGWLKIWGKPTVIARSYFKTVTMTSYVCTQSHGMENTSLLAEPRTPKLLRKESVCVVLPPSMVDGPEINLVSHRT